MSGHCGVIDTEPLALTLSSIHLFIMLHLTRNNIEVTGKTWCHSLTAEPVVVIRTEQLYYKAGLICRLEMDQVWLCFLGLWCVHMCFIPTSHRDSLVQMCGHHRNLTWCIGIGVFARLSGGQQRLLIELIWRQLTSGPLCSPSEPTLL